MPPVLIFFPVAKKGLNPLVLQRYNIIERGGMEEFSAET